MNYTSGHRGDLEAEREAWSAHRGIWQGEFGQPQSGGSAVPTQTGNHKNDVKRYAPAPSLSYAIHLRRESFSASHSRNR